MAVLQVVKGLHPGELISIEGDQVILGRHPDCQIVLDVGAISREHAQITVDGGAFFVEDLKSRNGTYVNGEMIQGRTRLADRDRLRICDMLFTFHLQPPSPGESEELEAAGAALVDDEGATPSTIMSTLDVSLSESGLRVGVRPEAKLRALLEIIENLGRTLDLDEVLPKIVDSLFKIFVQADRGFILLKQDGTDALIPKAIKHRRDDSDDTIRISRTIVNQVMNGKEAILSADAATDSRFDMSQSITEFQIRSMMCAPLVDSGGNPLGVIQIDTVDQRARFKKEDLDVLASVARQAAFAVETAQYHENSMRQQRIEQDLMLAHQVQQGFLPRSAPAIPGYEFFDFYEAANQLGGDYYDYIQLPGNRLAVVLADVSGKGVPAALLMATLSAETRYCLASEAEAGDAMTRLNAKFTSRGWDDRFVTMVIAVIDLTTHQLVLVNAGHMPPLLRHRDGSVSEVGDACSGVPLGVDPDAAYEQMSVEFRPGDAITMFTDGLSEAMNNGDDLYGIERLRNRLAKSDSGTAKDLGQRLLDDVRGFVGQRPQSDDMCVTCVSRA